MLAPFKIAYFAEPTAVYPSGFDYRSSHYFSQTQALTRP